MSATTTLRNSSSAPRTIAWSVDHGPRPSTLNPAHWDPVRGDHGGHVTRHHVTIPVGQAREVPSDVLADLRARDPIVAAWFDAGDLVEVQA